MYTLYYLLIIVFIPLLSARQFELGVHNGGESYPGINKEIVLLGTNDSNNNFIGFCSGAILSDRWIISAGHCFIGHKVDVVVKKYTINKENIIIATVNKTNIIIHPDYEKDNSGINMGKDLALLKTTKEIILDYYTWPIAIDTSGVKEGQFVNIVGFGGEGMAIPRTGSMYVAKCMESALIEKNATIICASENATTVSAEPGDSGGPLKYFKKLVGITSNEICEHEICQDIFVDVSFHTEWIKEVQDKYRSD